MASTKKDSLDSLIQRATLIYNDCIQEQKQADEGKKRDLFLELKSSIIEEIRSCRVMIRERHVKRRNEGNSVQVIKQGNQIEQLIQGLNEEFRSLSAIYTKQCKYKSKFNLNETDLKSRYDDIGIIKKQIDELFASYKSSSDLFSYEHTIHDELGVSGEGQSTMNKWRGKPEEKISDEDQAVLKRWKERDALFDQQLDEIAKAVDNMGSIAIDINEKIGEQLHVAVNLKGKVGDTTDDVVRIHNRLKDAVTSGKGKFCVRFFLIFAVIVAIIILASTVIKRFF